MNKVFKTRKINKLISLLFTCIFVFFSFSNEAVAAEVNKHNDDKPLTIGEIGGYLEGQLKGVSNIFSERRFTEPQGQGFAAERANNLADVLRGKKATVVGDNNVKNGPDRQIINRDGTITYIQDKYYKSHSETLNAAFDRDTGLFKYIDPDGKPMQLEVPADQFDKVLANMKKKISEGKVPGVTDPEKASEIVRKGKYTYQQTVNLTKAGNIDSLKYDAKNGAITAVCAMGISFALDYASCKINGTSNEEALKYAGLNSLKSGSIVFASYVISSQLAKTGLKSFLAPTAEAVAKHLSKGVQKSILETFGVKVSEKAAKDVIVKQVGNILSTQLIFDAVIIVTLTVKDVIQLFKGRISKEQLLKNLAITVASVAGAGVGSVAGAAIGTAIAPGIGTAIGKVGGGIIGGVVSGLAADAIADIFYKGDAEIMFDIISHEFQKLAEAYLVTEKEADIIVDKLKKELNENKVKDMFQSKDRNAFAVKMMEPLFTNQIKLRGKISIPTELETRNEMKQSLTGIVFIH